jgi:putative NIF3 family GTP cyclohydrolase 1 type 2
MAQKLGIDNYRILIPSISDIQAGLGVIGELNETMETETFLAHVANTFASPQAAIRWVEGPRKNIRRVALCGGAGAEFMEQAIAQGADAYISADFKYHELQSAYQRITVVDMDHWVSEHFTREIFHELLAGQIKTHIASTDKSPVRIWKQEY